MNSLRPSALKEPTFYFLVIAAAISITYWLFNNDDGVALEISREEIEARILITELTQGFPADTEQRAEIERMVIDDYVLVLEAYEMGLQNDARINDILAQKMRHVLSGNVIQPDEQELVRFYNENPDLYREPQRLTATELVLIGQSATDDDILRQLQEGVDAENLETEANRMVGTLPRVTRRDLEALFDAAFASLVVESEPESWTGPFVSNRGLHFLRVTERTAATTPPLEQVREQVRLDWIAIEEEARLRDEVARLRERYEIRVVNGAP